MQRCVGKKANNAEDDTCGVRPVSVADTHACIYICVNVVCTNLRLFNNSLLNSCHAQILLHAAGK